MSIKSPIRALMSMVTGLFKSEDTFRREISFSNGVNPIITMIIAYCLAFSIHSQANTISVGNDQLTREIQSQNNRMRRVGNIDDFDPEICK